MSEKLSRRLGSATLGLGGGSVECVPLLDRFARATLGRVLHDPRFVSSSQNERNDWLIEGGQEGHLLLR